MSTVRFRPWAPSSKKTSNTSNAQVAQSVEQRTENPRVDGSIPPLGTMNSKGSDLIGAFFMPDVFLVTALSHLLFHLTLPAIARTGIELTFDCHDLRHTHASLIINNGRTLHDVQSALANANISISERSAHFSEATRQKTSDTILNVVSGAIGLKH